MSALQLNLTKQGEDAPKLNLNLDKGDSFKVRLSWDGDTDLDLHALHAINFGGQGEAAKVSSMDDILSTYNVQRTIRGKQVGTLVKAADGTFRIHGGALVHSPDALDGGLDGDDEWVTIKPDMLNPPAGGGIEIPLIAMIHPQDTRNTFRNVKNARVIIEDGDKNELLNVSLSDQFGEFVGVQMGSIIVEASGSTFAAVGVGFNADFNEVVNHFA